MPRIEVIYEGELHTEATHVPSGTRLATDAPVDNQGRGESFSPTDLVATALGTCMLTTMGIVAARRGIDLRGSRAAVAKHMATDPVRRIGRLDVTLSLPARLTAEERTVLERTAMTCPVHRSLREDVEIPVEFRYDV